jgi:CYTH domain-containing protein/predicted metalloenzyme YecM
MFELKNIQSFLDRLFAELDEIGFDVSPYNLDHIGYQAGTTIDYENKITQFKEIATLEHEAVVENRRVGVMRLEEPIEYKGNNIIALEIIEPKNGQVCTSEWRHAEFVITDSYESFLDKHAKLQWVTSSMDRPIYNNLKLVLPNDMQVKFHRKDILETVKLDMEACQVHTEIERKFIVKEIPQKYLEQSPMEQERYYLYADKTVEMRIQSKGDVYELERKVVTGTFSRETVKLELTEQEFDRLKMFGGKGLRRKSYRLDKISGGSIKEYLEKYAGLIRAEFEFESEKEANSFIPPEWVGREITHTQLARDSRLIKLGPEEFKKLLREHLS